MKTVDDNLFIVLALFLAASFALVPREFAAQMKPTYQTTLRL